MASTQIIHSKLIVLGTIRYGETSLIVRTYTRELGSQSYMVKGALTPKKSGLRAAYFQPLTCLEAVVTHKQGAERLESIKEAKPLSSPTTISQSPIKSSTALFLAEVFTHSLKGEQQDYDLFDFMLSTIETLEHTEKLSNFLLLSLLELSRHLGIYPEPPSGEGKVFDLVEGQFVSNQNKHTLSPEVSELLSVLLRVDSNLPFLPIAPRAIRSELLERLIDYYQIQISGFKSPRSLEVIQSIF